MAAMGRMPVIVYFKVCMSAPGQTKMQEASVPFNLAVYFSLFVSVSFRYRVACDKRTADTGKTDGWYLFLEEEEPVWDCG